MLALAGVGAWAAWQQGAARTNASPLARRGLGVLRDAVADGLLQRLHIGVDLSGRFDSAPDATSWGKRWSIGALP